MKTQWIHHKGKRVLLADFSNFGMNVADAQKEMDEAVRLARAEPHDSVCTLTDVRGTKGSPEMFAAMRATSERITPYAKRRAVVGIAGAQRVFLDIINKLAGKKSLVTFDDIDKARDWLVE